MKKTYTKLLELLVWQGDEGHCCNVIRPHPASALIPASVLIPPILSSSSPDVHDEIREHSNVLLF